MRLAGLALPFILLLGACSTVNYDIGYSKDGKKGGFEDDLAVCKEQNPDSSNQRDACMSDKGWTRSDAIKISSDE